MRHAYDGERYIARASIFLAGGSGTDPGFFAGPLGIETRISSCERVIMTFDARPGGGGGGHLYSDQDCRLTCRHLHYLLYLGDRCEQRRGWVGMGTRGCRHKWGGRGGLELCHSNAHRELRARNFHCLNCLDGRVVVLATPSPRPPQQSWPK